MIDKTTTKIINIWKIMEHNLLGIIIPIILEAKDMITIDKIHW
jgi:hypothetical protein